MNTLNLSTATRIDIDNTIDELVYLSYKWNRQRSPQWTVEQWSKVYGITTPLMELRYQAENNAE